MDNPCFANKIIVFKRNVWQNEKTEEMQNAFLCLTDSTKIIY